MPIDSTMPQREGRDRNESRGKPAMRRISHQSIFGKVPASRHPWHLVEKLIFSEGATASWEAAKWGSAV